MTANAASIQWYGDFPSPPSSEAETLVGDELVDIDQAGDEEQCLCQECGGPQEEARDAQSILVEDGVVIGSEDHVIPHTDDGAGETAKLEPTGSQGPQPCAVDTQGEDGETALSSADADLSDSSPLATDASGPTTPADGNSNLRIPASSPSLSLPNASTPVSVRLPSPAALSRLDPPITSAHQISSNTVLQPRHDNTPKTPSGTKHKLPFDSKPCKKARMMHKRSESNKENEPPEEEFLVYMGPEGLSFLVTMRGYGEAGDGSHYRDGGE